ncbi:uncharacterized protein LOC105168836 [Sesamum indicum]|uniref:Uncharacterized protein LOC105168836 n=1 Tax=Sesamum indicum TaxID=4182 RepID=A0A6I9TN05_SESIN|nr:uncharacterized protein LOC105168836 [Sesamum indicum]
MAKLSINIPVNLQKIGAKGSPLRRNSTGNSSLQTNYLRASIGSCHDFCKYGIKRSFPAKSRPPLSPKQNNNVGIVLGKRSQENNRGKKALNYAKLVSTSARKQPTELKPKPCARCHKAVTKQPNGTFLKSSSYIRTSRNNASKEIRTSKVIKKSSYLSPTNSSSQRSAVKVPTAKSRTRKSLPKKVTKSKSETEKTSYENIPEKIIHVIEPKEEKQTQGLAEEDSPCTAPTPSSNSNQNAKPDSAAEIKSRPIRIKRVVQEEKDSSPRKLKFRRARAVEIQNGNAASFEKSIRRLISDGEFMHRRNDPVRGAFHRQAAEQKNKNPGLMNSVIEETASKLVQMRQSKVKALVGAFECVINIQDSESPRNI